MKITSQINLDGKTTTLFFIGDKRTGTTSKTIPSSASPAHYARLTEIRRVNKLSMAERLVYNQAKFSIDLGAHIVRGA